ncbi:MAG: hypothetical protein K0S09_2647 [Sphingobacteriaceae bacterium]|jgi:hypothetical protein|nr:hypothetical protein [Sphingobacteriaceae bacterium]
MKRKIFSNPRFWLLGPICISIVFLVMAFPYYFNRYFLMVLVGPAFLIGKTFFNKYIRKVDDF